MDKRKKAQWVVSGVVEAPVEKVWQALLDSNDYLTAADRQTIARDGKLTTTIGKPSQGKITIEVDAKQHSIATQGEWWYRGVQSVEPHARGSLLTYRVYNIAPGIGWWAAQLVQGREHARVMQDTLQASLEAIGKKLGVAVAPHALT